MASYTASIGTKGQMRVSLDLVSQDAVKNTSIVRVKGEVWLTSGTTSDTTGNCKAYFTGTNTTTHKTIKGSYSTTPKLILDSSFTVEHDPDGTKTVSYTFNYGPSSSIYLGKVVSTATVVLTLPEINTKPGAVTGVGVLLAYPDGITVSYPLPFSNTQILEYLIEYAKNNTFTNSTIVSASTSLSKTITGLDIASTYYFRVRARNAGGVGEWSGEVSKAIPNIPGKMAIPLTTFTPPATIALSFTQPSSDGGSSVIGYDVQYSTDENYTQATTISTDKSPVVINNLSPDVEYYRFRVRAKNLIGAGVWSDSRITTIVGGPKVSYGGKIYSTLAFVKYNGIYQPAIPYVKEEGVWRVAGG